MAKLTSLTKEQTQILADKFGGCGCKDHCQMEQYGEAGADSKPRGRFAVCELEAGRLDVELPKREADSDES